MASPPAGARLILSHTLASGSHAAFYAVPCEGVQDSALLTIDPRLPEGLVVSMTQRVAHTDGTPARDDAEAEALFARLTPEWMELVAGLADRLLREQVDKMASDDRRTLIQHKQLAEALAFAHSLIPA